jgi:hypothetical protein
LDQDEVTLTDVLLNAGVAAIEGRMNRALQDHPRMRSRQVWPIQADHNEIPFPTNMIALHAVKKGSTKYTQFPAQLEAKAVARPPSFINYGSSVRIWPIPTEDTDYVLECSLALQSILNPSPGDSNWVSTYHADIYQTGLMAQALGALRDTQNQAVWDQQFNTMVDELQAQGWNEGVSSGDKIHVV